MASPDPDLIIGLIISVCMLGFIPLTILLGMWISRANLKTRLEEKRRIVDTYKELLLEKLDIIKTAVAVGYSQDDMQDLDERLERLIGSAQMQQLIHDQLPSEAKVKLKSQELLEPEPPLPAKHRQKKTEA